MTCESCCRQGLVTVRMCNGTMKYEGGCSLNKVEGEVDAMTLERAGETIVVKGTIISPCPWGVKYKMTLHLLSD